MLVVLGCVGHDLVYGRTPKAASLGPWDMYSLARKGKVKGLKCMTLLILKQLYSVSYRVSGMYYCSSYFNCWFCLYCLCSFLWVVKTSL